jgi:hypothetical protein
VEVHGAARQATRHAPGARHAAANNSRTAASTDLATTSRHQAERASATQNLPDFGQIFGIHALRGHDASMQDADIVERVASSTGLPVGIATRVVEDVLAFYRESAEAYVRRRHAELQAYGKKNREIFPAIAGELTSRLVAPPEFTERQLRRIVYG